MNSQHYLKSIVPVKLYQSGSQLFIKCISKLSRNTNQGWESGTNQLGGGGRKQAIEQAILQALESNLGPKEKESGEELVVRSQIRFKYPKNQREPKLSSDDDEDQAGSPKRLRSQILLKQYKRLYEDEAMMSSDEGEPSEDDDMLVDQLGAGIRNGISLVFSLIVLGLSIYVIIVYGERYLFIY